MIYVLTPKLDYELESDLEEFDTKEEAISFIEESIESADNYFNCTFKDYRVFEGKELELEEKKAITRIQFKEE